MNAVEYHTGLTKFFGQFRGIATNYNQIVRLLNSNFSDKKHWHTSINWKNRPQK
jgi:hypothetical protein